MKKKSIFIIGLLKFYRLVLHVCVFFWLYPPTQLV